MHTFLHGSTRFHYHSDLSGTVHIVHDGGLGGREDANIPGEALVAFLAAYVRAQRISALEDASDAEILGMREEDMPSGTAP